MNQEKPIVFFKSGHLQFDRAVLRGIQGHPRLGSGAEVITSKVLGFEGSEQALSRVETLNTIYCRDVEVLDVMAKAKQTGVPA